MLAIFARLHLVVPPSFGEFGTSFFCYRYFGHYGIIRDIVHSHILQTIALFAMEQPVSLDGEDIRNEKVNAFSSSLV